MPRNSNHAIVALARYQSIIETQESGELDYDSVDPHATKPTKAAIRVNDLLETITGIHPTDGSCRVFLIPLSRSVQAALFLLAEAFIPHRRPNLHL